MKVKSAIARLVNTPLVNCPIHHRKPTKVLPSVKHADIALDTDLSFGSIEDNSSFELEDPAESRRYTATFGK